MGRPLGVKNKKKEGDPGYKKPGSTAKRNSVTLRLEKYSDKDILDYKVRILEILIKGGVKGIGDAFLKIRTPSQAARHLGIDPVRVQSWIKNDKDFRHYIEDTYEVIADDIEEDFIEGKAFIPKMMLLKGIRPKYRDTFKIEASNDNLEKLLTDLKNTTIKVSGNGDHEKV